MRSFSPSISSGRLLAPLVALALAAALACTSNEAAPATATPDPATPQGSPQATPTAAPEPQLLRIRMSGDASTLDPQQAADVASMSVVRSLFSSLLRIDADQQIQPDVALAVPTTENGGVSADGLTYTFRLRAGLKWSDGTDLVAQDFVHGARRLFAPGAGNQQVDFYRMIAAGGAQADLQAAQADDVEGDALVALEQAVVDNLEVFAPDDRTVVYRLNAPSPVFPVLATLPPLAPAPQHAIDEHGDA